MQSNGVHVVVCVFTCGKEEAERTLKKERKGKKRAKKRLAFLSPCEWHRMNENGVT